MRSRPEDAIWEGEMNLADFMDEVWPPLAAEDEVARTSEDMFHTLKSPS